MTQATQAAPQANKNEAKESGNSVDNLMGEMRDEFLQLERAVAGYNAMAGALQSATGSLPKGERKRGLPIFNFKATSDGRNSLDVAVDLKLVPVEYLGHVLGPLIHAQGRAARKALSALASGVAILTAHIDAALASQGKPIEEADGDEEANEED